MEADFSWIYLIIFLMVPLARIIPRILKRKKLQNITPQNIQDNQFGTDFNRYQDQSDTI